jgi:hypothetical protein
LASTCTNASSASEKIEIIHGLDKTTEAIIEFLYSAEVSMNICADHAWPSVAMGVEVYKKGLFELKTRNVKFRTITDVTKDNIEYCKELMQIAELRHLDGGSDFKSILRQILKDYYAVSIFISKTR